MKQSIGTKMENCIHVYYINYTEIYLPGDCTVIVAKINHTWKGLINVMGNTVAFNVIFTDGLLIYFWVCCN